MLKRDMKDWNVMEKGLKYILETSIANVILGTVLLILIWGVAVYSFFAPIGYVLYAKYVAVIALPAIFWMGIFMLFKIKMKQKQDNL